MNNDDTNDYLTCPCMYLVQLKAYIHCTSVPVGLQISFVGHSVFMILSILFVHKIFISDTYALACIV